MEDVVPFRMVARFTIVCAITFTAPTFNGKPFTAAAQQQPQVLRMIIQSHPNAGKKCLDIPSAQYIAGMRLQTFDCNNQNDETFAYDQGTQRLFIGHLCVESWGRGDAADAVGLGVCIDAPNQQWRATASGEYYQFAGMNNHCLEIKAGAKDGGAPLQIANCQTASSSQLWALIEAPNPQPARCTHISLHVPGGGDVEFLRTANDEWVNQFVDPNGKPWTFNWRSLSESDSELILYDQSRDRYGRFDLFGRKTYARNGATGGWGTPASIIRSDC